VYSEVEGEDNKMGGRWFLFIGICCTISIAGCQGAGEHTKRRDPTAAASDVREPVRDQLHANEVAEAAVRNGSDASVKSSQGGHLGRGKRKSIGGRGPNPLRLQDVRKSAQKSDSDKDGVSNWDDNCGAVYNPEQTDSDGDLVGDACDQCPGKVGRSTITGCPGDVSPCAKVKCELGEICIAGRCKTKPVAPVAESQKSRP